MSSTKFVITFFTVMVILSLTGLSSAAPEFIDGEALGDSHEYIESGPDYAIIEKGVYHELYDNAKVSDSAFGTVCATSEDGNVTLNLDSDIAVWGAVKGDAQAILYGYVYAEGNRNETTGEFTVNTEISSSVILDPGVKGKAEGKVAASGEATAMNANETPGTQVLFSTVSGSTMASGKTESSAPAGLISEGIIYSFVNANILDAPDYELESEIESEVEGKGTSTGFASATGAANAYILDQIGGFFTGVEGNTSAAASGKGDGRIFAEAEMESEVDFSAGDVDEYYAGTSIYTDAYVEGNTKSFTGSASALAETPPIWVNKTPGLSPFKPVPIFCPTNYAVETIFMDGNSYSPAQFDGNSTFIGDILSSVEADGTSASKVNVKGPGRSGASSEIFAEYYYPNTETYVGSIHLDDYLEFEYELSSEFFDESKLWGEVGVEGDNQYFSGKASTMAGGAASATATDDIFEPTWTSNTFAVGGLSGDASATGTGDAYGYTDIESVNLVDVTGGFIGISSEYGIPLYDANISLPDIHQNVSLPELPSDISLPSGMVLPAQMEDGFMTEVPIPDIPSFSFGTGIPERTLTEFSQITSESSAFGNAKKDTAMVSMTAQGLTDASGTVFAITEGDPGVSADTMATGMASTMANAQMKTDPASTAVIMAVSSPFASEEVQFANLLDASFIGTVSFADGIRGYTTGTAEGFASANSNVNYLEALGPATATGSVDSKAYANGGTGISAGIIGAGSYLDFYQEEAVDTQSVSAALLGSVSSALGTARAESDVEGYASAYSVYSAFDGEDILASTFNDVFATGNASTFAKTSNNGIALAADGIIAGQYASAFTDGDIMGEGEIIGGSIIADAVFAQRPGSKGSAEAGAEADGYGSTLGDFYAITNGIEDPVSAFVNTGAFGEVGGDASVKCGDPLSASVIMSFADANGGNTEGFPEGNTYAAGLMLSASVANGQCAQTNGYADGGTIGVSSLFYNGTPVGRYSYNASSFAVMEGSTYSSAISTSADTIALGLGIDGVSSSSEFYENADGQMVVGESDGAPWPSFFDLSIKGALAAVLGDGTANAGATVDYADAVSTADVSSPISGILESVYGETTATGDAFANVKSKGGIGIGGAIEGSGVFIEAIPNLGGAPSTDITDFSGMAAIAFAEGDGPKDTVSADSGVFGVTDAFGNMSHPKAYVEQYTNATGVVTASVLSNKYTDPLAGSIILSYGNSELDGVNYVSDNYDATLIATAVLADGYKAQGTATAAGSTEADGLILDEVNGMAVDAWGSTKGTFISDVSVAKGDAIALSGAGSSSSARFDNITGESRVRDMNVMGSFTEGAGDYAGAFAGYNATSEAESQVAPIIGEVGMVYAFSESGVNGVGGSDIQAKKSQAESISFGMAYQEAVEGEAIENTVFSAAAFGTFAAATDGAKNTLAGAYMSDVDMYAYAENMTRYSDVDYGGGVSYITLDPDGKPRITWDTYATWVYTDGVYELAADEKAYDTTSQPNYGIWYKYVMASDVPLPDPPKPDDILPFLGVIPP